MDEDTGDFIDSHCRSLDILCLLTVTRAGSKFFHSLLDDHPNVVCFPRKFNFYSFWRTVSRQNSNLPDIIDTFLHRYDHFFAGNRWSKFTRYERTTELGASRNETFWVDENLFRERVSSLLEKTSITSRSLFLALHFAYMEARGKSIPDRVLLLYHIHDAILEEELRLCTEDFPKCRALVTTKNPLLSLDSIFNLMKSQNRISSKRLYVHFCATVYDASNLLSNFSVMPIKVLPFERLHTNSKDVMDHLCSWLKLDWKESLLSSTIHGKLWWGNGMAPRNGFRRNWPAYTFDETTGFRANDWKLFYNLTKFRMRHYGYVSYKDAAQLDGKFLRFSFIKPTHSEWSILKSIFSPTQWARTAKTVLMDIREPQFTDYNHYFRSQSRILANIDELRASRTVVNSLRFCVIMSILIYNANPVSWVYFYLKRIAFCWQVDRSNNFSDLPDLL